MRKTVSRIELGKDKDAGWKFQSAGRPVYRSSSRKMGDKSKDSVERIAYRKETVFNRWYLVFGIL